MNRENPQVLDLEALLSELGKFCYYVLSLGRGRTENSSTKCYKEKWKGKGKKTGWMREWSKSTSIVRRDEREL